jgi:hypothetical protein
MSCTPYRLLEHTDYQIDGAAECQKYKISLQVITKTARKDNNSTIEVINLVHWKRKVPEFTSCAAIKIEATKQAADKALNRTGTPMIGCHNYKKQSVIICRL